jgi:deoxycytidylate deaminase
VATNECPTGKVGAVLFDEMKEVIAYGCTLDVSFLPCVDDNIFWRTRKQGVDSFLCPE